ncbi:cell division protein FtsL [Oceanicoccus sp. KOV_DT_Chl]|uniref:cell division protein FtsL n=1 Tax=Oceanicoccus sp. KOV_DT_Chl TaxID=1904639 RepID=UPI000C7A1DC4|nr:cell division protein FtsL [Oceanicoccus sp. KOV_DT_Chl]
MKSKNKSSVSVTAGGGDEQVRLLVVNLLLLVLVVCSATAVIYSSWKSRQLFSDLQMQSREAVRLEEDWGRLLLEQSTWASHVRIERLAKTKLNMVVPDPATIVIVKQ